MLLLILLAMLSGIDMNARYYHNYGAFDPVPYDYSPPDLNDFPAGKIDPPPLPKANSELGE